MYVFGTERTSGLAMEGKSPEYEREVAAIIYCAICGDWLNQ